MWIFSLSTPSLTLYLSICAGVSALALSSFANLVQEFLAIPYGFVSELTIVLAQVPFQWAFMYSTSRRAKRDYMVVALSVSMAGSLLLIPLLILNALAAVSALLAVGYFTLVVGTIFVIHFKCIVALRLPKILTMSWVFYRILLLIYVLTPRNS
jgi:hypothetical protein